MKKTLTALSLLFAGLFGQHVAQAQYVNIPDANFRFLLKSEYPTCFNTSNQLDTVAAANATNTTLYVSGSSSVINNLQGLHYFKKLTTLSLYSLPTLQTIGKLPSGLREFNASTSRIAGLAHFSDSLRSMRIEYCDVVSLPILPPKLKMFFYVQNNSSGLNWNYLPPRLQILELTGVMGLNLTAQMPDSLFELYINGCSNVVINSFGAGLQILTFNAVTFAEPLPAFPEGLQSLAFMACPDISTIPAFPSTLFALSVEQSYVKCLPHLPNSLLELHVGQMDSSEVSNVLCLPNKPEGLIVIAGYAGTEIQLPVCSPTNDTNRCANAFPRFVGRVFADNNGNGVYDNGEPVFANRKLQVAGHNWFAYTDENGYYNLPVDTTGAFSVTLPAFSTYYTTSNFTQSTVFDSYGQAVFKDFPMTATLPAKDLKVDLTNYTPARTGFSLSFKLDYENVGTVSSANSVVKFVKPANYTVSNASLTGYTVSGDTLIWNVGTLAVGQGGKIIISGSVSASTALGNVLYFKSLLNNTDASDNNLADNTKTLNLTVTGSYDPNDKQAREAISPAQIAAGEYIDYTIRFQNTGTDTAFTVVIADTLANALQANTLEMVASSHNVRTSVKGNVVYFEHLNIQLPDSNVNEKASHGFVSFRIKPQTNLALGSTVSNKAAIYFDYNAPVITNTALTKVQNPTGIFDKINKTLATYPNPVDKGVLYIPNMAGASATLTSLEGKELRNWSAIGESVSLEGLAQGMYLLKVTQKGESRIAKVMVK